MSNIDFRSHFPIILGWTYPAFAKLLGVYAVNELLKRLSNFKNQDFIAAMLSTLDIKADVYYQDLHSIPKEGPVIFVANHPCGLIEGLLGLNVIHRLRSDIKVIGNSVLFKFHSVHDLLIPVEYPRKTSSIAGVKKIVLHLKKGGALLVFPAGNVASFVVGRGIVEHGWHPTVAHLILKLKLSSVPVHFGGHNSIFFYLAQTLAYSLSNRVLLFRELLNKKGARIPVSFGKPISYNAIQCFENSKKLADYLCNEVLEMQKTFGVQNGDD